MNTYTIEQAWNKLDDEYPIQNVYDTYVLGEDWEQHIADIDRRIRISRDIQNVENSVGLSDLYIDSDNLIEAISLLELPVFAYKYDIPEDITREIKLALREKRKILLEVNTKIEELRTTVFVEEDIFAQ